MAKQKTQVSYHIPDFHLNLLVNF